MKHKLLAITLSIAVLSPLALTFALVILSPFESAIESESALPRVENYLPFALWILFTYSYEIGICFLFGRFEATSFNKALKSSNK